MLNKCCRKNCSLSAETSVKRRPIPKPGEALATCPLMRSLVSPSQSMMATLVSIGNGMGILTKHPPRLGGVGKREIPERLLPGQVQKAQLAFVRCAGQADPFDPKMNSILSVSYAHDLVHPGLARTPVSRAPFWLTSSAVTFSEKILPPPSVPKIRTGSSTAFLGSRRFPFATVPQAMMVSEMSGDFDRYLYLCAAL
jgi:hypothetical protein